VVTEGGHSPQGWDRVGTPHRRTLVGETNGSLHLKNCGLIFKEIRTVVARIVRTDLT
jgi:hypothetical protein